MPRPLVPIAALLIAGLIIGVTFPALGAWTALAAAVLCLATAAGALRRREFDPGSRWVMLAVLPLGVWLGARTETRWREAHDALKTLGEQRVVTVRGRLDAEPSVGRHATRLTLAPVEVAVRGGARVQSSLGVDLIFASGEAAALDLRDIALGDEVAAEGVLSVDSWRRNPGGFDRQSWEWQRGVVGSVNVVIGDTVVVTPGERSVWARFQRAMRVQRMQLESQLHMHQGIEAGDFSSAVVLGQLQDLDDGRRFPFVLTGLGHIFAVSGLHVGILYVTVLGLCALLRVPKRWAVVIAAAALLPYCVLVGLRVPPVRATTLVYCFVAGRLLGRSLHVVNNLAVAALLICVLDPRAPWQPGFQMSFVAVLVIILYAPVTEEALTLLGKKLEGWKPVFRGWTIQVAHAALVLLAIQFSMIPLMAEYYHRWSPLSFLVNLIALPLVTLIMVGGFTGLLFAAFSVQAATLMGHATAGIHLLMVAIVESASNHRWVALSTDAFAFWVILIWYAVLFGTPAVLKATAPDEILRRRARWAIAWCGLVAIALWLPFTRWSDARLRVTFLDVGQGDSTLIELPSGVVVLVDGGRHDFGNKGLTVVDPALRARGISKVDVLVATHTDADHVGGLVHIARHFPVGAVVEGDTRGSSDVYQDFQHELAARSVERRLVSRGAHISDGEAEIAVLHPDPDTGLRGSNPNDNSLVLLVDWRDAEILIQGDAEFSAERMILEHLPELDTDVLRTGHHGSRNATGASYLDAVTPAVAVVSTGPNAYGHPHPDHLARLADARAMTLRTDQHGAVTVETDGRTLWVMTAKQMP
jgi:competence protein ComEC